MDLRSHGIDRRPRPNAAPNRRGADRPSAAAPPCAGLRGAVGRSPTISDDALALPGPRR
jgi:hypothetical protein